MENCLAARTTLALVAIVFTVFVAVPADSAPVHSAAAASLGHNNNVSAAFACISALLLAILCLRHVRWSSLCSAARTCLCTYAPRRNVSDYADGRLVAHAEEHGSHGPGAGAWWLFKPRSHFVGARHAQFLELLEPEVVAE